MTKSLRTYSYRRATRGLLLFVAMSLGLWTPSGASQPEETLPGLKLSTPLMFGQIDNVNPYNGDPGIRIPLGPAYPLGPGNTFQLVAVHSSKHWHFDSGLCGTPVRNHAAVNGYPTLGTGWSLELGWIGADADGFAYHSSSGRHRLAAAGTGTWTTHDGSRLRVKAVTSPTGYTVEFPDGTTHRLDHAYTPPRAYAATPQEPDLISSDDFSDWDHGATPGTRYGLTTITDSFSTLLLTVSYAAASGATAWRVESLSLANPSRTIDYVWTTQTISNVKWDILDSITFPTAGGTLVVAFTFQTPQTMTRNGYDTSAGSSGTCPTVPADVRVPFLSQIAFQDDNSVPTDVVTFATYDFTYGDPEGTFQPPDVLRSLTLPTKGTITYDYDREHHCLLGQGCPDPETGEDPPPTAPDADAPEIHPSLDTSAYVIKRTTTDPFTGISATITFDRRTGQVPPSGRAFRWVVVTEPSGNGTGVYRTRHVYFTSDTGDTDGLEVLIRHYPENDPGTGTPVRTAIRCYETDSTTAAICGYRSPPPDTDPGLINNYGQGLNARLQKDVTWYGENPQGGGSCPSGTTQCAQVAMTTWDPLALRYETKTLTSNVTSMSGWTKRTTTTNWNPQTGGDWLLNLFTSVTTTDSGSNLPVPSTVAPSYSFSTATGFLNSITETGAGGGSLVESSTSTNGNATTHRWDGTQPGISGTFIDTQTFQSGLLTSRQRTGMTWKSFDVIRDPSTGLVTTSFDPNGLATIYSYDRMGRLLSIAPPGESATTACYLPPTQGTAFFPWFVIVKKGVVATPCSTNDGVPAAGSGSFEGYQYDGFGRVLREIRRLPNQLPDGNNSQGDIDGYFARRETRYDSAGHVVAKSEWILCEEPDSLSPDYSSTDVATCAKPMPVTALGSSSTAYSSFDPFGRPRHVVRPDGTATDNDFTDGAGNSLSDSLITTTVHGIAGGDAVTVTRRDALGRIIEVQEPNVTGESNVKTSYKYNVLDKLAEVKQVGAGTTLGTTQTRTFNYDAFGFLQSEIHPEKYDSFDDTPSAVVTTYVPDALGDVTQKVDGGNDANSASKITYIYAYDQAGRLTQASANGLKYAVNCYDAATTCDGYTLAAPSGSDKVKARLRFAIGYSYIPTIATVVTHEYKYESSSGRISSVTTTPGDLPVTNGGTEPYKMTQTLSYNSLGLLSSYGHPRASGTFTETTEFKSGLPTKITASGVDVVKAVTYDPAGNLASWTAGNSGTAIVTSVRQDPSSMPRPDEIKVSDGTSIFFRIKDYTYDGAGNITRMTYDDDTHDDYVYDARSRITSAALVEGTRSYKYDRFGNLTANGSTNITVNAARNQVSSGGATYDSRGNLTAQTNEQLWYDALNRQTREIVTGADQTYLYDGNGQRTLKSQSKSNVLRREMVRYVAEANVIARNWTLTACDAAHPSPFNDVPNNDPDCPHIRLLANQLVVAGCPSNPGFQPPVFCPNATVTRAQAAVILNKGYEGASFVPECHGDQFSDVSCTGTWAAFAPYIEELGRDHVSAGCGGGLFCPGNSIGEWEMLVWLAKGGNNDTPFWASYHPAPRASVFTYRDLGGRLVTSAANPLTPGPSTATAPIYRDNVFLGNLLVASYISDPGYGTVGWEYYFSDHLGTPRKVRTPSGTLETRKYWPYGEPVLAENSTQSLRFVGMERDLETARFYDHARFHDAALGRFTAADSFLSSPQAATGWNRYQYVRNRPLRFVDPNGQQEVPTDIAVGAISVWESMKQVFSGMMQFSLDGMTATLHGADAVSSLSDMSREFQTGYTLAGVLDGAAIQGELTASFDLPIVGGGVTGGISVINGTDVYLIGSIDKPAAGASFPGLGGASLNSSLGLALNYTGPGSAGGLSFSATSSGPIGVTVSGNPFNVNGGAYIGLTLSNSVSFGGGSVQIAIPLASIPQDVGKNGGYFWYGGNVYRLEK